MFARRRAPLPTMGLASGDQLIDEIQAAQPDVLRVAYAAYLESGAEAVVCIAKSPGRSCTASRAGHPHVRSDVGVPSPRRAWARVTLYRAKACG
jgi:hypothetical protein